MTILEKNEIKISNTKQGDFDIILNNEKENFNKDFHKNYSKKFLETYSLKYFNAEKYNSKFLLGSVFFIFVFIFLLFNTSSNNYDNPYYVSLMGFIMINAISFHSFTLLSPVKKILNKMYIKKTKNIEIIKERMFLNSIPDNNFVRNFINCYGEKAAKEILMNKENITYSDIIKHIKEVEEKRKKYEREQKVDEIVKCVSITQ